MLQNREHYVSTLVAILEDRGLIFAEDPIDHYIPELAKGGWSGVRVIDILNIWRRESIRSSGSGTPTPTLLTAITVFEASLGWLPKATPFPGPSDDRDGKRLDKFPSRILFRRVGKAIRIFENPASASPLLSSTSASRSFVIICSAVYLFRTIFVPFPVRPEIGCSNSGTAPS